MNDASADAQAPYGLYTWLWWAYRDAQQRYVAERRRAQALAAVLRVVLAENTVRGHAGYVAALEELG